MTGHSGVFAALSTAEWEQLTAQLASHRESFVTLVLTDGSSLVGTWMEGEAAAEAGTVEIALPFSFEWERVTVPRSIIAGGELWTADPSTDVSAARSLPPVAGSFADAALREVIDEQGLGAVPRPPRAMGVTEPVTVREIDPGRSILYADWEALARRKGLSGSVSVGFSVLGVGISATWEQSIERQAWRRLDGAAWDWSSDLPPGAEAVVEAHATLLLRGRALLELEDTLPSGDESGLALIVLRRLGIPEIDGRQVWETGAAAAIRSRALGLPLLHWESVVPPLRFWGEVVRARIETELGVKSWYLRVLAVGVDGRPAEERGPTL